MTQAQQILIYMEYTGSIDPAEAFYELGVYRLSARIFDLRAEGHDIETEIRRKEGKRWAVYRLKKPLPGGQTGKRQGDEGATLPSENNTKD